MSKSLIPAQRRERIHDYLAIHRIAPSTELSSMLEVSEATIRRDLEWMENEGILVRTHGGAILNQQLQLEPEYQQRVQHNIEEKRQIGATAASLIEDGNIVFINSGTTTTEVIRNIPRSAKITVITNNLSAALEAGEIGYEILLLGGSFQPKSNSVTGRFAIDNLGQIYASQAFIGVDGISLKHGFTVPSDSEAELIRVMMERTNGRINIVADHSKWGVVCNFQIARIDQVNLLITDGKLSTTAREVFTSRGVEVLIAGKSIIRA